MLLLTADMFRLKTKRLHKMCTKVTCSLQIIHVFKENLPYQCKRYNLRGNVKVSKFPMVLNHQVVYSTFSIQGKK